jgi:hypothetical protein
MSDKEILTKALEKASTGGWSSDAPYSAVWAWADDKRLGFHFSGNTNSRWDGIFDYATVIYDHDFAKALWPNRKAGKYTVPMWQHHLTLMVIAPDPMAYLGSNI